MDPLGLWSFGDPLPQSVVNYGVGFGDGIVSGLSLVYKFRNYPTPGPSGIGYGAQRLPS